MSSATSYTVPGMHVTDREVEVPLDWWDDADPRRLTVFVREVVDPARRHEDLPLLVFLQGGPGGKGPRPTGPDGWLGDALTYWTVVPTDPAGWVKPVSYVGLIASILLLTLVRDWLRTVLLVPVLVLASFVWENVMLPDPSSTRYVVLGAILVSVMIARPAGLLGERRVEIV